MICECSIYLSVAFPELLYCSILSDRRHDIRKRYGICEVFLGLLTPLPVTFHIRRRAERDIVNEFWPSCKVAVTLVLVKRTPVFFNVFTQNN